MMGVADYPTGRDGGILFVCLGNLCRSPMAEGMAADAARRLLVAGAPEIRVASAGIAGLEGEPATPEAVHVMRERGIDIGAHRARRLTLPMLEPGDLVIVMEDRQSLRVRRMSPGVRAYALMRLAEAAREEMRAGNDRDYPPGVSGRAGCLEGAADSIERAGLWSMPDGEYDVPDPIGLRVDGYRAVADMIERPIVDILRLVLGVPEA